jgi:hypothetical protein
MSVDNVSAEELDEFIALLGSIGLSVRKLCKAAASEEYNTTEKEVDNLSEAYRKRFSRKSMSRFEFEIMQDVLAMQPEFIKSNMVTVGQKKDLFKDASFEKSISSAFKSLHLK